MARSVPVRPAAVVSCHVERPLDDEAWRRFAALQRRPPGGLAVAALIRPPHGGEDRGLWLERARVAAVHGPLGHHTHWTSPTHARPTGGDPGARVLEEGAWLREQGLEPTLFCGGGWYMDLGVARAVAALGYADCTARGGRPRTVLLPDGERLAELPTTHSLGALARGALGRLPAYVHAYFHDYDLLDLRRRVALLAGLHVLARRRPGLLLDDVSRAAAGPAVAFSEAFGR